MEHFSKDQLIHQALQSWSFMLDRGGSPGHLDGKRVQDIIVSTVDEALLTDENLPAQMLSIGLALWADAGFPQVEVSHKFAAALLVSDVSQDALDIVRMPWQAFCIEVPDGLLHVHDPERNAPVPVRRIMVVRAEGANAGADWNYMALTTTKATLWRVAVRPDALLPPAREGQLEDFGSEEMTESDSRVTALLGRLIINICLALSSPELSKEVGPGHEQWTAARGNAKLMKGRTRRFVVGRPVIVDLRDRVREYVGGRRGKAEVRSLVRGHFRRQHFGEGRSESKIIWIEPHWRGPEEAATVVRRHIIKAD